MGPRCVHGTLVNDTCLCDLLWQGDSCDLRECHAGQLKNGLCQCQARHVGEFCEYHACYHKDTLYCWGVNDVEFKPCNHSLIGNVDPETAKNLTWYCPCGDGIRTSPPRSHCICNIGYGGEFCNQKCSFGGVACSNLPIYATDPTSGEYTAGVQVPDSVKVALVCMSMIVLVAVILWLKKLCLKRHPECEPSEEGATESEAGLSSGNRNHLMPAHLSATLLMMQSGQAYNCNWADRRATAHNGRRNRNVSAGSRTSRLPSYDEANAAPPSYSTVIMTQNKTVMPGKNSSRKPSTSDPEAGMAGIQNVVIVNERSSRSDANTSSALCQFPPRVQDSRKPVTARRRSL